MPRKTLQNFSSKSVWMWKLLAKSLHRFFPRVISRSESNDFMRHVYDFSRFLVYIYICASFQMIIRYVIEQKALGRQFELDEMKWWSRLLKSARCCVLCQSQNIYRGDGKFSHWNTEPANEIKNLINVSV